jgi:hypothetical protein
VPFRSKAQQRFMFAAEARGDLKPGTAMEFAHATPSMSRLPQHVGDKAKKRRRIGLQ